MPQRPQRSARRRGPGRPTGARSPRTRNALLAAARALMSEKGLPRVTLREVAERAGVQPALVHYYFGAKRGLLQAVTDQVAGEMLERVQHTLAAGGSTEQRLRNLIASWVAALAEDPYAPRLVVEQVLFADSASIDAFVDRFGRAHVAALTQLLEEGRAAGETRDAEPRFLIPAMLGMCVFYFLSAPIHQRLFQIERITPELAQRFAEHTADLVLRGLLREAPEAR